jgi:hypothetical protein
MQPNIVEIAIESNPFGMMFVLLPVDEMKYP